MDFSKVEKLAEIMKAQGLAEVEVVEGNDRIRLVFQHGTSSFGAMQPMMMPNTAAMYAPVSSPLPQRTATDRVPPPAEAAASSNQKTVKSPFVGTFYEASSPGSEPFVRIGKRIKKGDTLCIIEAMKLMNGIESEVDGVITQILIRNGEPVEYDQPLFIVEP